MRFCPKCRNYLYHNAPDSSKLNMVCKNCGYSEPFEPKSKEEALILETNFRSGSSASGASSGITVNEYTKLDPTLPHINTIRCPNGGCPSNGAGGDAIRDVIYIKTDPANLKFQYICTQCDQQWTN
jgi:DNA-directed RNA polymerase subunit M/transcription elongation factor TFIIS